MAMQKNTIDLTRDDILTALRVHLMIDGFPFSLTEKPHFNPEETKTFELIDKKLLGIKQDFINKRDSLGEGEKDSCTIEVAFSEEELGILLLIFEATAKEFPRDNDMDLRMHVPSREAFDSLHSRLMQLSRG